MVESLSSSELFDEQAASKARTAIDITSFMSFSSNGRAETPPVSSLRRSKAVHPNGAFSAEAVLSGMRSNNKQGCWHRLSGPVYQIARPAVLIEYRLRLLIAV